MNDETAIRTILEAAGYEVTIRTFDDGRYWIIRDASRRSVTVDVHWGEDARRLVVGTLVNAFWPIPRDL